MITETETALKEAHSKQHPYVEAYLEYTGPAARWAGPNTFVVHVVAKDLSVAEISIRPDLFGSLQAGQEAKRGLANYQPSEATPVARAHLSELAKAMEDSNDSFFACLYPVRVRLLRADGSVFERNGCRSREGWASVASKTLSQFLVLATKELKSSAPERLASVQEPAPAQQK